MNRKLIFLDIDGTLDYRPYSKRSKECEPRML